MEIRKLTGILLISLTSFVLVFIHEYLIYYLGVSIGSIHSSYVLAEPFYVFGLATLYWATVGYSFFWEKKKSNGILEGLLAGYISWGITYPLFFYFIFIHQAFIFYLVLFLPVLLSAWAVYFLIPKIPKSKFFINKRNIALSIALSVVLFTIGYIRIYNDNEGSQFVKGCKAINNQDVTHENIKKIGPVARWDGHNVTFREVSKEEFDMFVKDGSYSDLQKSTLTDDSWECFLKINPTTKKLETRVQYHGGS